MDKLHPVYTAEDIGAKVATLGADITRDYEKILGRDESLLMVGVLNGAFIFMADLIRAVTLPVEVDFIGLSSYQDSDTSSAKIIMSKDLGKEAKNRHILVVDDIVDSGLTMIWLFDYLKQKQAASVKVAVAIDKLTRRESEVTPDYAGFISHGGFLVGYGLDYAGTYRNLPGIYQISTQSADEIGGVL